MPLDPDELAFRIGMLSLDQQDIVNAVLAGPPTASMTPVEARAARAAARATATRPIENVEKVHDELLDLEGRSIGARVYRPQSAPNPTPAMVLYHGGGYVLGSLDDYDPLCRQLANRLGAVIVSVDYRLAPEYPFPALLDDAYDAWRFIVDHASEHGIDPAHIGVGGDSAGGGLAAAVCLLAQERGVELPAVQLLVYPLVQWELDPEDYDAELALPPLTAESMEWFLHHTFIDRAESQSWRASPLHAEDLSGLPPAIVVTAEFDVLRPTIETYVEHLRSDGVEVTPLAYGKVVHGFFSQAPLIATATKAVDDVAAALRPLLGAVK